MHVRTVDDTSTRDIPMHRRHSWTKNCSCGQATDRLSLRFNDLRVSPSVVEAELCAVLSSPSSAELTSSSCPPPRCAHRSTSTGASDLSDATSNTESGSAVVEESFCPTTEERYGSTLATRPQ